LSAQPTACALQAIAARSDETTYRRQRIRLDRDPHRLLQDGNMTRLMTVRFGAVAWLLAAQFFVVQVVVASAWTMPFSLRLRYISDLGNTACAPFPNASSVIVCSPWHAAMNASFVIVGITMVAGAVLTRSAFRVGWARSLAASLFVAAGVGVLMVGVYPENENMTAHAAGAGINFIGGNMALVLFGIAAPPTPPRRAFRWFSVATGLVGLAATVLFVYRHDLGLGPGGIERVAAYTTTVWQIAAGVVVLRQPESD
jgi:hypothetical membrane protein